MPEEAKVDATVAQSDAKAPTTRERIRRAYASADASANKKSNLPPNVDTDIDVEYAHLMQERKRINALLASRWNRLVRLLALIANEPELRRDPLVEAELEYNRAVVESFRLVQEDVRTKRFAIRQERLLRAHHRAMWAAVLCPFATALAVAVVNALTKH